MKHGNAAMTAGRVIFALPFALFGVTHLMRAKEMAPMVPLPNGALWIMVTGVAMIAASVGILTGILGRWAAVGLSLLLMVFVAAIHVPNLIHGVNVQMTTINLLKDLALAGSALSIAGLFGLSEVPSRAVDHEPTRVSRPPRYSAA